MTNEKKCMACGSDSYLINYSGYYLCNLCGFGENRAIAIKIAQKKHNEKLKELL